MAIGGSRQSLFHRGALQQAQLGSRDMDSALSMESRQALGMKTRGPASLFQCTCAG